MNDESYYIVYRFMKTKLNLKNTELEIYAFLYGYYKNGKKCYMSKQSIADFMCVSRRHAYRCLTDLTKRGLLNKIEETVDGKEMTIYSIARIDLSDEFKYEEVERNVDENPKDYTQEEAFYNQEIEEYTQEQTFNDYETGKNDVEELLSELNEPKNLAEDTFEENPMVFATNEIEPDKLKKKEKKKVDSGNFKEPYFDEWIYKKERFSRYV